MGRDVACRAKSGCRGSESSRDGVRTPKVVPVHRKSHGGGWLEAASDSALIELVRWDPEGYGLAELGCAGGL